MTNFEDVFDTLGIENQLKQLAGHLKKVPDLVKIKIAARQNEINKHNKQKKERLQQLKNKALESKNDKDLRAFATYKQEYKQFCEKINHENEVIAEAQKILPELDKAIAEKDTEAVLGFQAKLTKMMVDLKE
jgi:hypothetical protein